MLPMVSFSPFQLILTIFSLHMYADKVRLTNYSSDKVAHITGDVMFSCTASGVPLPAISWYKDGSLLDTNISNITTIVVDNSTLTATLYLSNLTLVDAGVYICNATDSVGGTETRQFSLTLQSLSLESMKALCLCFQGNVKML